jgi:hypothetical protein
VVDSNKRDGVQHRRCRNTRVGDLGAPGGVDRAACVLAVEPDFDVLVLRKLLFDLYPAKLQVLWIVLQRGLQLLGSLSLLGRLLCLNLPCSQSILLVEHPFGEVEVVDLEL